MDDPSIINSVFIESVAISDVNDMCDDEKLSSNEVTVS